MTTNKKQKRIARQRASKTGESYSSALAQVRAALSSELTLTPRLKRLVEMAEMAALDAGDTHLGVEHLIEALADGGGGAIADEVLGAALQDVTRDRLRGTGTVHGRPAPWSSVALTDEHGQLRVDEAGLVVQYFVDADGQPVIDEEGWHLGPVCDATGRPVTGSDDQVELRRVIHVSETHSDSR